MASRESYDLIVRNGTVVSEGKRLRADVAVRGEKIEKVAASIKADGQEELDARGCFVVPGGIDAHTHLDLPVKAGFSSDSFETGTAAALKGGTTTIIDFANQVKGGTLADAIDEWHRKADGNALCDYGFHVSVTDFNERTRREIQHCVKEEGITSFKTFTAYKSSLMIDDRQMLELMAEVSALGGIVTVHAENGDLIDFLTHRFKASGQLEPRHHILSHPAEGEAEAAGRVLELARAAGCPVYIVHLSAGLALERVLAFLERTRKEKERPPVILETCVQYLLLDQKLAFQKGLEGAKYICSPPIRQKSDREALWQGLKRGQIQVLATDHCPFLLEQKALGEKDFTQIPNGIPGIENRMELLFSEGVLKKRITIQQFVECTSAAPARIFGLFPTKGRIAVGADADIAIFDPKRKGRIQASTQLMNCDYSVYEGQSLGGTCRATIHRGKVAYDGSKILLAKGYGRYLKRKAFASH